MLGLKKRSRKTFSKQSIRKGTGRGDGIKKRKETDRKTKTARVSRYGVDGSYLLVIRRLDRKEQVDAVYSKSSRRSQGAWPVGQLTTHSSQLTAHIESRSSRA